MGKPKRNSGPTTTNQKSTAVVATPRSLAIFAGGIKDDRDFAAAMSTMMGDLIEGSVTPAVGNAVCKAGGNLLKVIELKYKYGSNGETHRKEKRLSLASGN